MTVIIMNKKIMKRQVNFSYFYSLKTAIKMQERSFSTTSFFVLIRNIVASLLIIMICTTTIKAQYPGAQISFGISSISNENESFTQDGTAHYGYHVGIDARLNEGSMFFNPGIHYYKFSLIPTESMDFFSHEYSITIIKGRMNMGFIFDVSRVFKPRFKLGGVLNYLSSITDPNPLNASLDQIHSTVSVNAGIGADISVFTIDFDYERGMTNGLKDTENSKFNYMTFSLGVFF